MQSMLSAQYESHMLTTSSVNDATATLSYQYSQRLKDRSYKQNLAPVAARN